MPTRLPELHAEAAAVRRIMQTARAVTSKCVFGSIRAGNAQHATHDMQRNMQHATCNATCNARRDGALCEVDTSLRLMQDELARGSDCRDVDVDLGVRQRPFPHAHANTLHGTAACAFPTAHTSVRAAPSCALWRPARTRWGT
jgi:hypothetical protein